jgi:hypothetical protein
MQRDVLDDAVTLVEDAEHRDALRHRRHSGLVGARLPGAGVAHGRRGCILLVAAAPACRETERARHQQ